MMQNGYTQARKRKRPATAMDDPSVPQEDTGLERKKRVGRRKTATVSTMLTGSTRLG